jgi:hypothetical protein
MMNVCFGHHSRSTFFLKSERERGKRAYRWWLHPAQLPQEEAFVVAFLGVLAMTHAVFLACSRIEQHRRFCLTSFDQARAYDCVFLDIVLQIRLSRVSSRCRIGQPSHNDNEQLMLKSNFSSIGFMWFRFQSRAIATLESLRT